MKTWIIIGLVLIAALVTAFLLPDGTEKVEQLTQENTEETQMPTIEDFRNKTVELQTSQGNIELIFYLDDAPKAVENFIRLAESGYYDGVTFHRVVKDFVIQAGDPTGTGSGGESIYNEAFSDELDPSTPSYQVGYQKGVLAMANSGPNTNGSQFFIMLADNPLPHLYTIFGEVKSGQDVVDKIGQVAVDSSDKPMEKVVIEKAVVK